MTQLVLECAEPDARLLIKGALERTKGIKKVSESDYRITGKTGLRLTSNGEKVEIDFNETEDPMKTVVDVRGEKAVEINVTAKPERYKRRFLENLNELRKKPTADALDELASDGDSQTEGLQSESTRESSSRQTTSTSVDTEGGIVILVLAGTLIFIMLMVLVFA